MPPPLILVDAYAQIYRGFHALPPLHNAAGQPTGAVFAFARFLLSLDQAYPSPYGAVVFDLGKPVQRLAVLPEYKAQRPPMPEELRAQTPVIREWLVAAGWPIVEQEGCEADDLLAGLAANFADFPVWIVSGDKDLCQLVDDRVQMLITGKHGALTVRGSAEVEEKFGVAPAQMADYLALLGDVSDNIPGVDGVGPKTAADLIKRFGSLSGMMSRLHEIGNENLRHRLQAAASQLEINLQLIRLERQLPETFRSLDAVSRRPPDWTTLQTLAARLELHRLARDLGNWRQQSAMSAESPPPTGPSHYTPDLFA